MELKNETGTILVLEKYKKIELKVSGIDFWTEEKPGRGGRVAAGLIL